MARFAGRVALVTGAGSGIGRAVAVEFARQGAAVVVLGRNEKRLTETVDLVATAGGTASTVVADVTEADQVRAAVAAAVARYGGLHIGVNNAGATRHGHLADLSDEDFAATFAANVTGTWLSMKYQLRHMRAHGGGAIVNVSSVLGAHLRRTNAGAYAASKAAVATLSRVAARENIDAGIRVNTVSPGPVDTPMSIRPGETAQDRAARVATTVPIGRVATVEEIAAAVLWLASPEASYVVGHDLVVDGGSTA